MTENSDQADNQGKTVCVIGATGLIGQHLIETLSCDPGIRHVHVFVRRKAFEDLDKVTAHVVDFNDVSTFKPHLNGDALFCCLGTTIKKAGSQEKFKKVDFDYPVEFAKAAKENGIETYMIVTAIGAYEGSGIFYNRVKGEVEQALKEIGFKQLFIFRPSLLLGKRNESRLGEKLATIFFKIFGFIFIGPLKKYQPIPGEVVAVSMADKLDNTSQGVFIYESNEI